MTHTEKLFLPIYIKEKEYKSQAVPEYGGKCRAKRGDRGMRAYTGQNRFTCLLQIAPFVNLSVDTFPDKRGQLTFRILLSV